MGCAVSACSTCVASAARRCFDALVLLKMRFYFVFLLLVATRVLGTIPVPGSLLRGILNGNATYISWSRLRSLSLVKGFRAFASLVGIYSTTVYSILF